MLLLGICHEATNDNIILFITMHFEVNLYLQHVLGKTSNMKGNPKIVTDIRRVLSYNTVLILFCDVRKYEELGP